MILDKKIVVIVAGQLLKYYHKLGYGLVKRGQKLTIDIEHLSPRSHLYINVKCDICGHEKQITRDKYYKNTKRINLYACSEKCAVVKIKQVLFENHGDENYNNRDKYKETCLEKYGCENTGQLEEVQTKMKETYFSKHGVYHNMQNVDSFNKNQLSGTRTKTDELTGLIYRGTYEKDFLNYCFNNKINVKNHSKSIKYFFEDKNRVYHPDFYFESFNLIIEIKSDYYFEKFKEKNLAKQKSCLKQGYNFIFIINKNYDDFNKIISPNIHL